MNDRRQLMSASLACAVGNLLPIRSVHADDAPIAAPWAGVRDALAFRTHVTAVTRRSRLTLCLLDLRQGDE
jgi:hypothetical protein